VKWCALVISALLHVSIFVIFREQVTEAGLSVPISVANVDFDTRKGDGSASPGGIPVAKSFSPAVSPSGGESSRLYSVEGIVAQGNSPPAYPEEALLRGLEGTVKLELDLGTEGQTIAVRVMESSGHSILDRAAKSAAEKWRMTTETPEKIIVPVEFLITR
jgi:TonB family protein